MVEENKVLGIKQNSTLNTINKAFLLSIIMCKYRHSYAVGSFTFACIIKTVSVSVGQHVHCLLSKTSSFAVVRKGLWNCGRK